MDNHYVLKVGDMYAVGFTTNTNLPLLKTPNIGMAQRFFDVGGIVRYATIRKLKDYDVCKLDGGIVLSYRDWKIVL
jgi:hypothetical protein